MIKHPLLILIRAVSLTAFILSSPALSLAQSDSSIDDIEKLITKEEEARAEKAPAAPSEPKASPEVRGMSDLGKLEPFGDIAVIQRRFLPKTGRFEFFGGPTVILNDAFFRSFGLNGRLAYYLSERYGVEFLGSYLSVGEWPVTTDIREQLRVETQNFVTAETYYGVDFKWVPVYGKMTWLNSKITPFDLYLSAGFGLTGTNQQESEVTLHFGSGQTFARTKSMAFRWDFSFHTFTARSKLNPAAGATLYQNLFLTLGVSYFFPEATYR
jgi:outer membrane beta-barrel protein